MACSFVWELGFTCLDDVKTKKLIKDRETKLLKS